MAVSLDQLLYGIRKVESGGNYRVVNSIGAVGAYQVMKGNVPEWTRQALGYSMTWQQFRDSKSAQDAVARYKLGIFYKKYGAEGAASMWFSGQPNPNSTASDGGNTVRQYVNKVIGASGGGSISSSGGVEYTASTPKLSQKELAEDYGFTMSFLEANPELKKLFSDMVSKGYSKDMFQAKLRDTKWWKGHSDKEREYLTQTFTDPATAKQNFQAALVSTRQLAESLGIKDTKYTLARIQEAAYNVVAKGWSDSQLRYYLGQYVSFDGGNMQGQGADVENELRTYAYSMGVSMSDKWYADNTRQVLRGLATTSDYKNQMLRTAKAQFPQYSKQLDAGQTVADIASPYMQSMAQILELPAGSINLFDPTIKKALQYKDPSTLQGGSKPMWQFENELRSDPRWKQTQNAQDSLMQVGHQVLSDFGFKY